MLVGFTLEPTKESPKSGSEHFLLVVFHDTLEIEFAVFANFLNNHTDPRGTFADACFECIIGYWEFFAFYCFYCLAYFSFFLAVVNNWFNEWY